MTQDFGGDLWLLLEVLFVAALVGAIIYGFLQWRSRKPSDDVRAEQATRDLYRAEAADEERRDAGGPAR